MNKIYEKPMAELVTFQSEETITESSLVGRALWGIFPVELIPDEDEA